MSIFSFLKTDDFARSAREVTGMARNAMQNIGNRTPGGSPTLFAGAMGVLLGALLPRSILKGAAIGGLGVLAWNFFKKWGNSSGNAPQPQALPANDPTATLMLQAMVYAARADGHIDDAEKAKIDALSAQLFPGQNMSPVLARLVSEPLNLRGLAAQAVSQEQREDLYALSCLAVVIDEPAERRYLNDLAAALGIAPGTQQELERRAREASDQMAAMN